MNRCVLLALMLVISVDGALAITASEAARRSARARGYTAEQTACFVPVFKTYATRTRTGRWVAGGRSRRADLYRHAAWSRCGLVR